MDFRTWDLDLAKKQVVSAPRTSHTTWATALAKKQGVDQAIRITRRYATDFLIGHKKHSEQNPMKGFYQSALGTLLKLKKATK